MARPTPADSNRRSTGSGEKSEARERGRGRDATEAAADQPTPDGETWADQAAQARTASDPRRVTPHDAAGVPSTGDGR